MVDKNVGMFNVEELSYFIIGHKDSIDDGKAFFLSDGRIGFGKRNPSAKIDVKGDLKCDGDITAPNFLGVASSAKKVSNKFKLQLNGGTAIDYDGGIEKVVNITPASIGAMAIGEASSDASSVGGFTSDKIFRFDGEKGSTDGNSYSNFTFVNTILSAPNVDFGGGSNARGVLTLQTNSTMTTQLGVDSQKNGLYIRSKFLTWSAWAELLTSNSVNKSTISWTCKDLSVNGVATINGTLKIGAPSTTLGTAHIVGSLYTSNNIMSGGDIIAYYVPPTRQDVPQTLEYLEDEDITSSSDESIGLSTFEDIMIEKCNKLTQDISDIVANAKEERDYLLSVIDTVSARNRMLEVQIKGLSYDMQACKSEMSIIKNNPNA